MAENTIDRRRFLGAAGIGAAAVQAAVGGQAQQAQDVIKAKPGQAVGIQIGSVSFLDEGTEKVIDVLQEKACVNTLFVASFTYGNGIASRQLPGHPLPDHGPQKYDDDFHGGNYATPHARFYGATSIKGERLKAPDFGNRDILAEVARDETQVRELVLDLPRIKQHIGQASVQRIIVVPGKLANIVVR